MKGWWRQERWQLCAIVSASVAGFYAFPNAWLWASSVLWMALTAYAGHTTYRYSVLNKQLITHNNELQEAADAMIAHAFETSSKLRERIAILEAELEERDRSA